MELVSGLRLQPDPLSMERVGRNGHVEVWRYYQQYILIIVYWLLFVASCLWVGVCACVCIILQLHEEI